MVIRRAEVRSLRDPADPYTALGEAIGTAIANLARQVVADVQHAVEGVPAQAPADNAVTVGMKEAAERLGHRLDQPAPLGQ
jgi:hypothetical protein